MMVDYLVTHPHIASGKFMSLHGNENLQGSWEELTAQLNAISKNGKIKDVISWKTTWRDNKTKTTEKVVKLRAARAKTGNGAINIQLSELDKKIMGILGYDYAEGLDDCPDSFPEEQMNAVEVLAAGDKSILNAVPVPLSCRPLCVNSGSDTDFLVEDVDNVLNALDVNTNIIQNSNVERIAASHIVQGESTNIIESPISIQSSSSATETSNRRQQKRMNLKQLGTQFLDARDTFARIEQNNKVMKFFARSVQQQADATSKLADVAMILAETDCQRNDIWNRMIESDKERYTIMLNLSKVLEIFVKNYELEV